MVQVKYKGSTNSRKRCLTPSSKSKLVTIISFKTALNKFLFKFIHKQFIFIDLSELIFHLNIFNLDLTAKTPPIKFYFHPKGFNMANFI